MCEVDLGATHRLARSPGWILIAAEAAGVLRAAPCSSFRLRTSTATTTPPPCQHIILRRAAGRAYALLGAATWGPVCAVAHAADDWLRPGRLVEAFLISQGLLDEPAPQKAAAAVAAAAAAAGGATTAAERARQRRQAPDAAQQLQREQGELGGVQLSPEEEALEFEQLPERRQVSRNADGRCPMCKRSPQAHGSHGVQVAWGHEAVTHACDVMSAPAQVDHLAAFWRSHQQRAIAPKPTLARNCTQHPNLACCPRSKQLTASLSGALPQPPWPVPPS